MQLQEAIDERTRETMQKKIDLDDQMRKKRIQTKGSHLNDADTYLPRVGMTRPDWLLNEQYIGKEDSDITDPFPINAEEWQGFIEDDAVQTMGDELDRGLKKREAKALRKEAEHRSLHAIVPRSQSDKQQDETAPRFYFGF